MCIINVEFPGGRRFDATPMRPVRFAESKRRPFIGPAGDLLPRPGKKEKPMRKTKIICTVYGPGRYLAGYDPQWYERGAF